MYSDNWGPLSPARGIVVAVILSLAIWAGIIAFVAWQLKR